MTKKVFAGIGILLLLSFSKLENFRALILNTLRSYSEDHPEKIYIQTDKPYYTIGDDIWFSAYLVNGINHQRSDKSRVLHVELINDKDSVVSQRLLYTNGINVAGDFKIGKDWEQGRYLLRAYTNYMRNQSHDYFFKKYISIWDVTQKDSVIDRLSNKPASATSSLENTPVINLDFYPESGYLVDGIPSKIGIKATDTQKNTVDVKGFIKDSDNNTITAFQTLKFGLGFATLTPKPNTAYYAIIHINGQEVRYTLPKALTKGYNLNIKNNGNEIAISATSTTDDGLENSFLIAHQRGHVILEKLETTSIKKYNLKLITTSLQDGIANFTLFDGKGRPVCERLVFIDNPNNTLNRVIKTNKTNYKTRDNVLVSVGVTDANNKALRGTMSVSVIDLDVMPHNTYQETIKTYLLLNSDLRGTIKNPGYYFEKANDPSRRFLLDLVMLTNGWRRFTWAAILNKKQSKNTTFSTETGMTFSGHTTALNKTTTNISASTRFTLLGNLVMQDHKQSDANGAFEFGPYVFFDSVPGFIEARVNGFKSTQKHNRNVSIFLDNTIYYSPRVNRKNIIEPLLDTNKAIDFINQSESKHNMDSLFSESYRVLEEVVINAKKKSTIVARDEQLDARTDYGFPTNRLDVQELTNSESLNLYQLLNRMPSVRVVNDSVKIRNNRNARVLLDGDRVELRDISHLRGNDIEFIDVLTGADAAFYSNASNGIVAVYTRRGVRISSSNIKRKPGIMDFTSVGFYTAREFYAPDHINDIETAAKPDIRTTLHWEPKLFLDGKNNAKFSFFTSDKKGRYGIVIEGITDTGIPIYDFSSFKVD